MIRPIALLLCLIPAGPQDPAEKVRALVDQLESDEIAEREGAQTELIKRGTANLPLLRELRSKAEGEKKARLDAIVGRLERDERAANLLGPGPLVTLKVKDRPAA